MHMSEICCTFALAKVLIMERRVRVRFAPSPTGALHIGGVRTALYNYLFARQHGGDMLLRIEDTDSTRFVPGAEEYILEALDWLGIGIDEGLRQKKGTKEIEAVGSHGPYRQSERREIYHQYVKQLLDSGHAYIAFDTPEELEAKRAEEEFNKKYEEFLDGQRDFPATILQKRQTELQQLMEKNIAFKEESRRLLEQAQEEAYAPLHQKLADVLQRVGTERGLAFIINTDQNACPFINPDMGEDVTAAVLALIRN